MNKLEVPFDKSSKQVDVHALKETLWSVIQESNKPARNVSSIDITFPPV